MTLSSIAPGYAQSAPTAGYWQPGPDASGTANIVGRIVTPRASASVNPGVNLLLSGWAVDLAASSGTGVSGVEVWAGARDKGGTKLATGSVGQTNSDAADVLGAASAKAGFTATLPSSALSGLASGATTLYVYVNTPKGSFFKAQTVNVLAPLALPFPNDPVVWVAKPLDGQNITQKQPNSKFTFSGVALDRNPLSAVQNSLSLLPPGIGQTLSTGCPGCVGATGNWYTQYRGAGVNTITAYIDNPPGRGDNTAFGNFGTPCAGCLQGVTILANNKGSINVAGRPQGSVASRNYGSQFDFSGWVISMNPMLLSPGPHTLVVTATSAVTAKTNTAKVTFNIVPFKADQRVEP